MPHKTIVDWPAQTIATNLSSPDVLIIPSADAWPALPQPLAPQEIEACLGQLIRRYWTQRSMTIAAAVVQHIKALCEHPDYRGSWEERCAYRRLARHWNGLAGTADDSTVRQSI